MKKAPHKSKRDSASVRNPMALAKSRVAVISTTHQDNLLAILEESLQTLHDRTLTAFEWDNLTQGINLGIQLATRRRLCADAKSVALLNKASLAMGAIAKRSNGGMGLIVFPDEVDAVDAAIERVAIQLAHVTVHDLAIALQALASLKAQARAGRIPNICMQPTLTERAAT